PRQHRLARPAGLDGGAGAGDSHARHRPVAPPPARRERDAGGPREVHLGHRAAAVPAAARAVSRDGGSSTAWAVSRNREGEAPAEPRLSRTERAAKRGSPGGSPSLVARPPWE